MCTLEAVLIWGHKAHSSLVGPSLGIVARAFLSKGSYMWLKAECQLGKKNFAKTNKLTRFMKMALPRSCKWHPNIFLESIKNCSWYMMLSSLKGEVIVFFIFLFVCVCDNNRS